MNYADLLGRSSAVPMDTFLKRRSGPRPSASASPIEALSDDSYRVDLVVNPAVDVSQFRVDVHNRDVANRSSELYQGAVDVYMKYAEQRGDIS